MFQRHAAEDHDDERPSFAAVRTLLEGIAVVTGEERTNLPAPLYRRFSLFVMHDPEQMDHEEHVRLADLQGVYTDAALQETEGRIVQHIPPTHMVLSLAAMLDDLPKAESAALFAGMKPAMPPAAFADLMARVETRHATVQSHAAAARSDQARSSPPPVPSSARNIRLMPTLCFDITRQSLHCPFATRDFCSTGTFPNCGHRIIRRTQNAIRTFPGARCHETLPDHRPSLLPGAGQRRDRGSLRRAWQ